MSKIDYFHFYSHILNLNLKVEVTGHFGYPILMFPTSMGQFTQNADFGLNDSVKWLTDHGKVKLINVETIDSLSFYDKGLNAEQKIYNYELYVQFLHQEFVPFIQRTHNTHRIGIAGCSFGGYHAANFAFRYPDLISHMICMSGSFSIKSFMHGFYNNNVYFNCAEDFLPNDEDWKFKHMHIVLSTSDWDICLNQTKNMSSILNNKGLKHWYDEKKWIKHDWPLWNMAFPEYLGAYFG